MSAQFPAQAFLARKKSTGEWLRRMDRIPGKTAAEFARDAAQDYAVPLEDIDVVSVMITSHADERRIADALNAGFYQGSPTIASPSRAEPAPPLQQKIDVALSDVTVQESLKEVLRVLRRRS